MKATELEKSQKKLSKELDHAEDRAKKVHDEIESIDHVARDLFKEWEGEIGQMSNGRLKSESNKLLSDSRSRHQQLIRQMQTSERKMEPVLQAFRDQVLFLKHNLNSKAIGSLKKSAMEIDNEVGALIREIERSNQQADQTIAGLNADSDNR